MRTRRDTQTAITGGIVLVFGLLLLIGTYTELNAWIWVAALALLGFLPFAAWLVDRPHWGWLIPAYASWATALLIALVHLDALQDEWVAVFVLLVIALPFLAAYLRNPRRWWWLIPAYTLGAVAVMILLIAAGVLEDDLVAAYVLFAIALPFFVVYARNRRNWWALIPAGILSIISLAFLISSGAGAWIAAVGLVALGSWMIVRGLPRSGRPGAGSPASQPEEGEPPAE